jgi:serine O-acetyltransferase
VHSQKVVIGPGVVIGSNLRIHHGCTIAGDLGRGVTPGAACPVVGDDVTIGLDAYVMGSVTVGDGAVIGAQSLVNKDVAPYTLVAGSPAKLIRDLPNPAVVNGPGSDAIEG